MTRRPPRASRGPEDPDDGVAVGGFQRRHRGVEADACGEEVAVDLQLQAAGAGVMAAGGDDAEGVAAPDGSGFPGGRGFWWQA
jgi:hypothetical protein